MNGANMVHIQANTLVRSKPSIKLDNQETKFVNQYKKCFEVVCFINYFHPPENSVNKKLLPEGCRHMVVTCHTVAVCYR